jgi:hypothetical protein
MFKQAHQYVTNKRERLEILKRASEQVSPSNEAIATESDGTNRVAALQDLGLDLIWDDPKLEKIASEMRPRKGQWPGILENFRFAHKRMLPTRENSHVYRRKPRVGHRTIISESLNLPRLLFTLVYGKDLRMTSKRMTPRLASFLADFLAYADFYGLLEVVSPHVERWALSLPGIWEDVRAEPKFWVAFSRLILLEKLFDDALKHMVGNGYWLLPRKEDYMPGYMPECGEFIFADFYQVARRYQEDLDRARERLQDNLTDLATVNDNCDNPRFSKERGVPGPLTQLNGVKSGKSSQVFSTAGL